MESAESAQSLGPAASTSWNESRRFSIALAVVTHRWRLSIDRAQGISCCQSIFREVAFGIAPVFSLPHFHCMFARFQNSLHRSRAQFLSASVGWLADCAYSFCSDDTPNIFETTFSTRQEIPEMSAGSNSSSATKDEKCITVLLLLSPRLSLPKNMGAEQRRVCMSVCRLPLPQCRATGLEK